jgi:site-specific recombinase XerD
MMGSSGKPSSTIAQGHDLVERLTSLLKQRKVVEMPSFRNRLSRAWIADEIGCAPGTLTTNVRLRKLLSIWEKEQFRSIPTAAQPVDEQQASNVIPFKKIELKDIILPVDIVILNKVYTVPTLYHGDRIDALVSRYLRHLALKKKHVFSSISETAKKLRIFRRFQHAHCLQDQDVTDDFLLAWQISMEAKGLSVNRRNDCITTVHSFFEWAEEQGFLKNQVQLRAKHEYPNLPSDYIFPISSTEAIVRRHGITYTSWVSTLIEPGGASPFGRRHTPTPEEIRRLLLEATSHKRNGVRNGLLISWAFRTGGRVNEILQVKVGDLPTAEEIAELLGSNNQNIVIKVKRKRRGTDSLVIPIELLLATANYVWSDRDRAKIVAKNEANKKRCDYVFMSEEGDVLTTDSVTRICGAFFVKAKIKNANIHRLRARYITEIIERCLDEMAETGQSADANSDWAETVLTMAQTRMGHSHITSLRPYLSEIGVRRIQVDGTITKREERARMDELVELNRQTFENIKHNRTLIQMEKLLNGGSKQAAAAFLRELANQIEAVAA